MSTYTRRQFGQFALASVSLPSLARAAQRSRIEAGTVRGVKIGAITGVYGPFTPAAGQDVVDVVVERSLQGNVGHVELVNTLFEPRVTGGAGYFDLRLLGFFRSVPVTAVKAFMPFAILGFTINLITGVAFFVMAPGMYALSIIWWVKVFFIVVAGLNAMLFETTLGTRVLELGPGEDTPVSFKIVGAVSLFSWFAVLYCGRMLPYLGTGN